MPLPKLKDNANQEEINEWIVNAIDKYSTLETDLEGYKATNDEQKNRITQLEQANQKLFLRVTTNKVEDETKEEEYEPQLISKEYFDQLTDEEKESFKQLESEVM